MFHLFAGVGQRYLRRGFIAIEAMIAFLRNRAAARGLFDYYVAL